MTCCGACSFKTSTASLLFVTDAVDFLFYRQTIQRTQRQAKKQGDTPIQCYKRLPERTVDFFLRPLCGGRIGNAPVCSERLSRPDGADFVGGVIADGKDEINLRRLR